MKKNKKIIAIIPARGGSKGIPRKNIKLLSGKPLITYTIEIAKKVKCLDKIIVSTEDKEIAKVSKKYGAEIIVRPQKLAGDKILISEVLKDIIRRLERRSYFFDYIVLLEPTSPLRKAKEVNDCIEKILKTRCDSVSTICQSELNPYKMLKFFGNKIKPAFGPKYFLSRRQDLPIFYRPNGAVYVIKKNNLKKYNNFFGEDARAIIMSIERSIDINNELDFIVAETIIKKDNLKK